MECKKSQHTGFRNSSFQTLTFLRGNLINTLENSTRHKTKAITVLNTRETRITPKLSMDMASPPLKLHSKALFLAKLSLLKRGRGFWQPRGTLKGRNEGEE
jgi:hypothetical protein